MGVAASRTVCWLVSGTAFSMQCWTVARLDYRDASVEQSQWPPLTKITHFKKSQLFNKLPFICRNFKICLAQIIKKYLFCCPFPRPMALCCPGQPQHSTLILKDPHNSMNSLQKEVRWRRVWWSWWSRATSISIITEEVLQEGPCSFAVRAFA